MSVTPTSTARRRTIGRVVAATGVAAVAAAGSLLFANTAGATASTLVHITAVSPHLVAATTANQVITVTGSGFDESVISGVAVTGCTAPTYIVSSATTLLIKTDATCLAAASPNVFVTITDTSNNTAVSVPSATGGAQALSFIAPPTIATESATVHPVTTDATAGMSYAAQTAVGISGTTKGGTVIRVTSGATGFSTSTATPLAASLDGVAMTGVTLGGGNGVAGNYFTATLGAHAADAAPVLKITNNGVSKSFLYGTGNVAGTFDFQIGGSVITVAPASGPSKGGNHLVITGSGFSTTAANDAVSLIGAGGPVTCPVLGTPTATSITCTVPADATPFVGPAVVQVAVTGGLTSVVSAGSTYTYVAQ
jgi:hypothetical protein